MSFQNLLVGPPGGPAVCYLVQVDVGDLGVCNFPLSSDQHQVQLVAGAPVQHSDLFGFIELNERVYLPLLLKSSPGP